MKPVNQTIVNFKQGNCIQACVASIFELELNEVPNFMEYGPDEYTQMMEHFCNKYGLKCLGVEVRNNEKGIEFLKGLYTIGIGLSLRGNFKNQHHGVVCYEGKIVHDPAGCCLENCLVSNEILEHKIFVVKNPSKLDKLK